MRGDRNPGVFVGRGVGFRVRLKNRRVSLLRQADNPDSFMLVYKRLGGGHREIVTTNVPLSREAIMATFALIQHELGRGETALWVADDGGDR